MPDRAAVPCTLASSGECIVRSHRSCRGCCSIHGVGQQICDGHIWNQTCSPWLEGHLRLCRTPWLQCRQSRLRMLQAAA